METNVSKETKHPLFNGELREKMEMEMRPLTEEPEKVVSRVEDTICSHLVLAARKIGEQLAEKLYKSISK